MRMHASNKDSNTLMIFDRGIADGMAFMSSHDEWRRIARGLNLEHSNETMQVRNMPKYDLVLHLQTMAANESLAHQYQTESGSTETRRVHNADEASSSDRRLQVVYRNCEDWQFIAATRQFAIKKLRALTYIRQ